MPDLCYYLLQIDRTIGLLRCWRFFTFLLLRFYILFVPYDLLFHLLYSQRLHFLLLLISSLSLRYLLLQLLYAFFFNFFFSLQLTVLLLKLIFLLIQTVNLLFQFLVWVTSSFLIPIFSLSFDLPSCTFHLKF